MHSNDIQPSISIGALSKLSGVPADTIRTWERRYQLLQPGRDAKGRRLYTTEDSRRLKMIAELVSQGERIATLASLDLSQLKARRELHKQPDEIIEAQTIRLAVLHPTIGEQLTGPIPMTKSSIQVISHSKDLEGFNLSSHVDAFLIDLACLGPHPDKFVDMFQAQHHQGTLILTYYYISKSMRETLQERNVLLVKSPVTKATLKHVIWDHIAKRRTPAQTARAEHIPEPARFERKILEHIMNETTKLGCECPNHISSLVLALREFELYSWSCMSENEEDMQLHHELAKTTGQARSLMEDMLEAVCQYDGIKI